MGVGGKKGGLGDKEGERGGIEKVGSIQLVSARVWIMVDFNFIKRVTLTTQLLTVELC